MKRRIASGLLLGHIDSLESGPRFKYMFSVVRLLVPTSEHSRCRVVNWNVTSLAILGGPAFDGQENGVAACPQLRMGLMRATRFARP